MIVKCEKCGIELGEVESMHAWIGGYECDDEEACKKRQEETKAMFAEAS